MNFNFVLLKLAANDGVALQMVDLLQNIDLRQLIDRRQPLIHTPLLLIFLMLRCAILKPGLQIGGSIGRTPSQKRMHGCTVRVTAHNDMRDSQAQD